MSNNNTQTQKNTPKVPKSITLEYEGEEYTLEFTRRTVALMEKNGFRLDDLKGSLVYGPFELFAGAFLARHRILKRDTIEKIYNVQRQKDKLFSVLIDMYIQTADILKDDEPGDEDETPTFRTNF